jgi:hypothetical protein
VSTCLVCSFVWRAGRCLCADRHVYHMAGVQQGHKMLCIWRQMLHGLLGRQRSCEPRGLGGIRPEPAVRLWCAAAPHIVACITACTRTRTRSSRSRRLQPLPLMVAARCTDTREGHGGHREATRRIALYCTLQAAGRTCRRSHALKSLAPEDAKSVSWQPRRALGGGAQAA